MPVLINESVGYTAELGQNSLDIDSQQTNWLHNCNTPGVPPTAPMQWLMPQKILLKLKLITR